MAQQLYAVYVQATKEGRRRQWIVMPPTPEQFNGAKVRDKKRNAIIFSRDQRNATHRATWKHELAGPMDSSGRHDLMTKVTAHENAGWTIGPVVICETTLDECNEAAAGRTPWPCLNRFKRIYSKRHAMIL
jgi:hypothetical protein